MFHPKQCYNELHGHVLSKTSVIMSSVIKGLPCTMKKIHVGMMPAVYMYQTRASSKKG